VFFLDTSALVKLVIDEAGSDTLRVFLGGGRLASSMLVVTELPRAVLRRAPGAREAVDGALEGMMLVALDFDLLKTAGRLQPPVLRSLDAIHLAAAITLREELECFVAYDERLLDAASALGLPVASPGLQR
jgi:predicted nucleic acid-binding protein